MQSLNASEYATELMKSTERVAVCAVWGPEWIEERLDCNGRIFQNTTQCPSSRNALVVIFMCKIPAR